MDKVNCWIVSITIILFVCFVIVGGTFIIIAIMHNLMTLCESINWNCSYTLEINISDNLIMYFWGLVLSIVGVGGLFISKYNKKMEKLRKNTIDAETKRVESIKRIVANDKLPHPFTCAKLSYSDIAVKEDIDNYIPNAEIRANLQHICRNVIDVIKLRFSVEYREVEFHCISGYRCKKLNDIIGLEEGERMSPEHEKGEAVDINISSDNYKQSELLKKLFQFIIDESNCRDLPLSSVILTSWENKQWIHISSSRKGLNMREFKEMVNGKYRKVLPGEVN